jgi:RNA polymerase sigma factor (sigma-70 family)
MTDSQHLLAEYARNGSDAAFSELVTRYVDLVYSTALRLVEGDAHRAEDVTQTVFVDLARQARMLPAEVRLGGWLHRHTCFVAAKTLRGERRRQSRERQAVEMNALQNHSETDFSQVAPLLDEAINELGDADRTAILLRFFEQQDFRAVGQALGSNEDAARMRVTRALEKLEEFLKRRGITTSAASLGVVLTANAIQAAPVGLAVTISTASALVGTTIATSATATATKAIAMTTLQKTFITATVAVALGTGIYEARQASTLRGQFQTLWAEQAEQAQQLIRERGESAAKLAALSNENERLNGSTAELLKLRGEVTRLRLEAKELAQSKDSTGSSGSEVALKSWLSRVKQLKRLPERMPDKTIPELRLLTEEDWLELAKEPLERDPKEVNLDDDHVARLAFSAVRGKAKDKLVRVFTRALEGYANANSGQLPTDTSQLKPYLLNSNFLGQARVLQIPESAVDDTVFRRYEILRTGQLEEVPNESTILAERAPVDSEYDTCLMLGRFWMVVSGLEYYSPEKRAVSP